MRVAHAGGRLPMGTACGQKTFQPEARNGVSIAGYILFHVLLQKQLLLSCSESQSTSRRRPSRLRCLFTFVYFEIHSSRAKNLKSKLFSYNFKLVRKDQLHLTA